MYAPVNGKRRFSEENSRAASDGGKFRNVGKTFTSASSTTIISRLAVAARMRRTIHPRGEFVCEADLALDHDSRFAFRRIFIRADFETGGKLDNRWTNAENRLVSARQQTTVAVAARPPRHHSSQISQSFELTATGRLEIKSLETREEGDSESIKSSMDEKSSILKFL